MREEAGNVNNEEIVKNYVDTMNSVTESITQINKNIKNYLNSKKEMNMFEKDILNIVSIINSVDDYVTKSPKNMGDRSIKVIHQIIKKKRENPRFQTWDDSGKKAYRMC